MTTEQRTTWALARLADVSDPDKPDGRAWPYVDDDAERARMDEAASPGAVFLRSVESSALELADELADSAVPVYTHERWQVFVDLAAYDEDTDELAGPGTDMTERAGVAPNMVAERLARAVLEEADPGDVETDERGIEYVEELEGDLPRGWALCGTCGRAWNDEKPTAWTPAPSGRCPFESEHEDEDDE